MSSISEELARLAALRDQGILTEEEFAEQKRRVLAGEAVAEPGLASAPTSVAPKKKAGGCATLAIVVIVVLVILYSIGNNAKKSDDVAKSAKPAIEVTANDLFRAYQANEAAAQQQYGDQPLIVSGTVDGVDLDFANEPIVKLKTDNQFLSAQAKLVEADQGRASSLSKGDSVDLRCESVSEVIGTPMLAQCAFR